MARWTWLSAGIVLGASVLYQQILHNLIFNIAGVGRSMQPIADFPYSCRRIYHEKLEACEDLWLDNKHRQLYLACAGLQARTANKYDTGELNASAFPSGSGSISVLDIDSPGPDGLYGIRSLRKEDFKGYRGDKTVFPNGFAVEVVDDETLRFFITDQQPLLDPKTNEPIEQLSTKKRSSVQVFKHRRGSSDMQYEYELSGDAISLPNRVTVLSDGNIVLTNDHTNSGGIKRQLELVTGGGSLTYCDTKTKRCKVVVNKGVGLPNGLQRGPDGLVHVPNCYTGDVQSYAVHSSGSLSLESSFHHPYPLDNLAFDANGDMWAPAIATVGSMQETMANPYNASWLSSIWRFRKQGEHNSWVGEKMLEDSAREIVSGITTVEHDHKTGRLFMTGAYTKHIVVCDPR